MDKVTIDMTPEGTKLNFAQAKRIGDILNDYWKDCPEVVVTVENKKGENSGNVAHRTNIAYDDGIVTIKGLSQEQRDEYQDNDVLAKRINWACNYSATYFASSGNSGPVAGFSR